MTRHHDWESKLDEFLNGNSGRAFKYGSWDCCLFVCDAIQAMTGVDPATAFRGGYRTRRGALGLSESLYGARTVRAIVKAVTTRLEMVPCVPNLARRGDVVMVKRSSDVSLGIVDLTGCQAAVLTRRGIERITISQAMTAFHV